MTEGRDGKEIIVIIILGLKMNLNQPLRPPVLTPFTIYFLVRIKRIIIGRTTIVEAAIRYSE